MATYYVKPTGSDGANGTSTGTAWQNISKVNGTTFSAGDIILFERGGTWSGTQLVIGQSGSSGNPITYGAYGSGAKPIITHTADTIAATTKSWVVIQDLEIRSSADGIEIANNCSNITVQDCTITNCGDRGIFINGNTAANNNISVLRCTIYAVDKDGVMDTKNNNTYVGYCNIYDVDNSLGAMGDPIHMAGNGITIEYNTLNYDNPHGNDKQAIMLEPGNVTGGGGTIIIRNNDITSAFIAITSQGDDNGSVQIYNNVFRCSINMEPSGPYIGAIHVNGIYGTADVVTIHHNVFTVNGVNKWFFGGHVASNHNINIYNNTYYGMPYAMDFTAANPGQVANIKNNIIYSIGAGNVAWRTTDTDWTINSDYNRYYRVSGSYTDYWSKQGAADNPDTLAELQTAFGGDANSSLGDPLFTNAASGDFTLSVSSPCINTGAVIAGITDGYSGPAPDIGAFEYAQPSGTALTNYGENLVLNWAFTNGAATRPTTWFIALHTADPTEAGSVGELSGNGYARQSATFSVAGDTASNTSSVTFGPNTTSGWGSVSHTSIWDAVSGGNCLVKSTLSLPVTMSVGDSLVIAAGGFQVVAG
jgi:hypothetical protein